MGIQPIHIIHKDILKFFTVGEVWRWFDRIENWSAKFFRAGSEGILSTFNKRLASHIGDPGQSRPIELLEFPEALLLLPSSANDHLIRERVSAFSFCSLRVGSRR